MAIYKTKPFEVEAVLFTGKNFKEVQDFVGTREVEPGWEICNFCPAGTYVNWDEADIVAEVYDKFSSWVGVKAGQYIIRGSKGEYYPCDPEVFESKYELKYNFTG